MSAALFWDFENLHASAFDHLRGPCSYRSHKGPHPRLIRVGQIIRYVASHIGPLAYNRAYADWHWFREYMPDFGKHLVDTIYVPPQNGSKNSADIALVVDALDTVLRDSTVSHVVIASCDGDFRFLAQQLRRSGKTVIGVGIDGFPMAEVWKCSCDQFLVYKPEGTQAHACPAPPRTQPSAPQAAPGHLPSPPNPAGQRRLSDMPTGVNGAHKKTA